MQTAPGKCTAAAAAISLALALALALALSACGTLKQGSGPGTENAAQNAALLRDVTAQVSGTMTQRRAHEFLTYVGFQGGMERCMAKEGQVYLPPAFEDLYAGRTTDPEMTPVDEAAGVSIAQARAHGFGEGDRIVALRGARKPTTLSPSVDDAGYGPAMAKCGRSASNFQGMPTFAEPLLTELTSLVIKTVRSSGAKQRPQDYAACMAGHQVPVQSREEAVAQAGARYGEIWQSEDARAWAQARELEVKAAVADAQCRTEAHETYVVAVGPPLRDFAERHRDELADNARRWAALVPEAAHAQAQFRAAHASLPQISRAPIVPF